MTPTQPRIALEAVRLVGSRIEPNEDWEPSVPLPEPDRVVIRMNVQLPAEDLATFSALCSMEVEHFWSPDEESRPEDLDSTDSGEEPVVTLFARVTYVLDLKSENTVLVGDSSLRQRIASWAGHACYPYFRQHLTAIAASMAYEDLNIRPTLGTPAEGESAAWTLV